LTELGPEATPRDRIKALINRMAELQRRQIMDAQEKFRKLDMIEAVAERLKDLDLRDDDAVRAAIGPLEEQWRFYCTSGPFGYWGAEACLTAVLILKAQLPPEPPAAA
jgi:hypothetical protein